MRPWSIVIEGSGVGRRTDFHSSFLPARSNNLALGEARIAKALSDAGALQEELKDFQRKVSDAGRATDNARVGAHDDLILAVAIALWFSENMPTSSHQELVF